MPLDRKKQKSSIDHFNDAAVWTDGSGLIEWIPLGEPTEPIINPFNAINIGGFVEGSGGGFFGDGWYYYENTDWWNMWFYDHPYDDQRLKQISILLNLNNPPTGQPGRFILAFNWSSPEWSLLGNPFPPIPPLSPADEELYIVREIVFDAPVDPGPYTFHTVVPDYNPEWVSVDISGYDYTIDGIIEHMCMGKMDMAFVINNPDIPQTGACCYNGGLMCDVMTIAECDSLNGTFWGIGTLCWGDFNQNGYDDLCDECCTGQRGDANCIGGDEPDISDIVRIIDNLYQSKAPLCCQEEADASPAGAIDVSDIVRLIDYLYISHNPLALCP